jgi:integral membrane protein
MAMAFFKESWSQLAQSDLGRLRIVGFCEGWSFLALFITMPIKYVLHQPLPNFVVGLAHGVLFIAYILLLLFVGIYQKWPFGKIFLAGLASLIPFGTFVADVKLFRER